MLYYTRRSLKDEPVALFRVDSGRTGTTGAYFDASTDRWVNDGLIPSMVAWDTDIDPLRPDDVESVANELKAKVAARSAFNVLGPDDTGRNDR